LYNTAISSDGQIVAFSSYASNLVADDTNGSADIFVHDRSTGITRRVSVNWWSGGEGNRESWPGAISADGQIVAFQSYASNLVEDDTNGRGDIFVHDPKEIDATWSNYGAGFPGTNGVPAFTARGDPVLDTTLTLDLENSYDHWTVGLFFIGLEQATLPTGWGGDLLVVPLITIVVGVPPSGLSFTGDLPLDAKLYGTTFDLQAIVRDPGAAEGVAFTPGLELLLGK
jgi:hypothetical protein